MVVIQCILLLYYTSQFSSGRSIPVLVNS
uniref:Uncharacterized protein n=1 Tax=Arundo donax TaxID=35708 RepID=A0A0A9AGH8_ARUDO